MEKKVVLHSQAIELTQMREQLGISIKVLAKEMDRAESTVGLWCSGRYPCDMHAVKAAMRRITERRYNQVMQWDEGHS